MQIKTRQTFRVAAALALGLWVALATAETPQQIQQDIQRHKAMAAVHERMAQCLSAPKPKIADCQKEMQASCKGLAIGKYCGMKHEH